MLDELIKKFLGDDELRPALMRPKYEDGNVIATNADILIIAPEKYFSARPQQWENPDFPKYKQLVPQLTKSNGDVYKINAGGLSYHLSQIPKDDILDDCEACQGNGELYATCEDCESRVSITCPVCKGAGSGGNVIGKEFVSNYPIKIGDVKFAPKYLQLLVDTAMAMFPVTKTHEICFKSMGEKSLATIIFEDVMILLMPVYGDNERVYKIPND